MTRLFVLADAEEMARRRARVPRGTVVEAWPDLVGGGVYWIGEESKAALESAGGPLRADLSLPAESIRIYYGPRVCDLDSLPREESLRARVVSAHGIAVAWITIDRSGERVAHEPAGPDDVVFPLRRPGGPAGHLWRRFDTRADAMAWMREHEPDDAEAQAWAAGLPVEDFETLLRTHAVRERA